jgi:hypothetical protein
MSLTSRVTIVEGAHNISVNALATLSVRIVTRRAGGSVNLRMADGSIIRQVAWEKDLVTLTCSGWLPPALSSINWANQITLTVPAPGSTTQYVGYADPPQQTRTAAEAIDCEWELTLEVG